MKYTFLGRSGLKVSRICLGTMNFGSRTDEDESFAVMDKALDYNINFFDTANRYGRPWGTTESIVGKWLKRTGQRDSLVLASKFYGPMGTGANDEGISAYHARAACEDSLKRLQTDRIDLYQMHHIPRRNPHHNNDLQFLQGDINNFYVPPHLNGGPDWDEIYQIMETLVFSGKIIYAGSSNFAAWNIAQANERARGRNFLGLVSEQSKYNLLLRTLELEVIPVCRAYGVGLLPYSPLASGALGTSLYASPAGRRAKLDLPAENQKQISRYVELCREIGQEPPVVALAWLLHNPVVTAPIIGPRTVEQLSSLVKAVDVILEPAVLDKLDEIFPGPGQAPEAYAW